MLGPRWAARSNAVVKIAVRHGGGPRNNKKELKLLQQKATWARMKDHSTLQKAANMQTPASATFKECRGTLMRRTDDYIIKRLPNVKEGLKHSRIEEKIKVPPYGLLPESHELLQMVGGLPVQKGHYSTKYFLLSQLRLHLVLLNDALGTDDDGQTLPLPFTLEGRTAVLGRPLDDLRPLPEEAAKIWEDKQPKDSFRAKREAKKLRKAAWLELQGAAETDEGFDEAEGKPSTPSHWKDPVKAPLRNHDDRDEPAKPAMPSHWRDPVRVRN
ncbi:hypothetical protein M885DRAFT_611289 [Pelagophyceae sp. CCMP2097]|nr:hypothetical protein M885DRAFT_611289 [Pelagophyceae sp. CCMP2097]